MREREFRRIFPKGSTIFSEGEIGHCAYIIERGRVEISTHSGGEKVVLATRGPGEIFGEMAIVDNKPRSANATAIEECDLNVVSHEQLESRLRVSDPVVKMVLCVVLERFRDTLRALKSETSEGLLPIRSGKAESKIKVHQAAINRIFLEQELERAIAQKELVLHYQPIVDFSSGGIAGFEALVRWQHPEKGLIPPINFLDVAEESGSIVALGQWVFEEACQAMHVFSGLDNGGATPGQGLFMSINVSAKELCVPGFVANLIDTVKRCKADPSLIRLEVTESLLVENPELARETLESCVAIGMKISIDDFGTGYSSLAYLQKFPVETIKIDRSFIVAMFDGAGSLEIVRATIALAQALGMRTVAEGIDEEFQEALLRSFGCGFGQGFLYAKPMTFDVAYECVENWDSKAEELLERTQQVASASA